MVEGSVVTAKRYDYIRDPKAIYAESFAQVRAAVDLARFPAGLHPVIERLVHSCARPDIAGQLVWDGDVADAGCAALRGGAPILTDAEMVARGVTRTLLPANNPVMCRLNDAPVPGLSETLGTTRSAAAIELWKDDLDGAVVAIGNAPTALFHLLERLHDGWPRPAAILAFPVGFVGAAESKDALMRADLGIPYITLPGRDGGSALAAAAVNGLSVACVNGGRA
ncbi:precorrin-8X methylmutase [Hwanghaeella grinnelliae]|uniref:Precorrin-8X methylmutase n=1 Tax=Hwanghaeella grinnelliae TaxID=2500179 RepID=A0A437QNR2_9PROT|nr:precorrin-8X methylmutase [Hwanghaeella grinnelliae]RVU36105.1 precorrin-8X methylmutase [Hwanghaeella grinnelliae]